MVLFGRHFTVASFVVLVVSPLLAQDIVPTGTKGVFLDNSKPAVKVEILRFDAGVPRVVSSDHRFKSGDRFRLRVELNRAGYAYLLNRTLPGDPDTLRSKGIAVLQDEEAKAGRTAYEAYRLIYPVGAAVVRLPAVQPQLLPADGHFLAMDDLAGVEKLLLVVSQVPMDFSAQFDLTTGVSKGPGPSLAPKRDTAERVIARLRARPSELGRPLPSPNPQPGVSPEEKTFAEVAKTIQVGVANTIQERHVTIPTKGVTQADDAVYAVPVNDDHPMLVEITLLHYAR